MQPLIDKFQINPETNKLFKSVIELFDGTPNYQFWAVKMVFSKAITFTELSKLHEWIENNQTMIKKLEKKNIVAYSNKNEISKLKHEIVGIDMLNMIKEIVSHFNTKQRKMLSESIIPKDITPLDAFSDPKIKEWAEIFRKFNLLPTSRKNNFYAKASLITDVNDLESLIVDCIQATYTWDKEDLLAFVKNNASDCKVVFDKENCVILEIPSFTSSKKLCGSGRTCWCLSMESHYFGDYVYVDNDGYQTKQYFLFDFSRHETDPFAHIGFTVHPKRGITYAQTCDNESMLEDWSNGQEKMNIYSALDKIGAKLDLFFRIAENKHFKWNRASFLKFAKGNSANFSVVYDNDNKIVVNVCNSFGINQLFENTMIDKTVFTSPMNYQPNKFKAYVILDFNVAYDNKNAIVGFLTEKDEYGVINVARMCNFLGKNVPSAVYFENNAISLDKFIDFEKINPSILLHKLIADGNEEGAIELIMNNYDEINVNTQFDIRVPVFEAINRRMTKLFSVIIKHPTFDNTFEDGFGDSILQSLLYIYGVDDVIVEENEDENLATMIKAIIQAQNNDLNVTDFNKDTALNIACEYPKMAWVVKELVMNENVDVNIKNDLDMSPLATALVNDNIEAVKWLCTRGDICIGREEKKIATRKSVNLNELVNQQANSTEFVPVQRETVSVMSC